MYRSHTITADERAGIDRRIKDGMSQDQASKCIDWIKDTVTQREKAQPVEQPAQEPLPAEPVNPNDLMGPPPDVPPVIGADGLGALLTAAKAAGVTGMSLHAFMRRIWSETGQTDTRALANFPEKLADQAVKWIDGFKVA